MAVEIVFPGRRIRILEVGQENIGAAVQSVDEHLAVDATGDLRAMIDMVFGIEAKVHSFSRMEAASERKSGGLPSSSFRWRFTRRPKSSWRGPSKLSLIFLSVRLHQLDFRMKAGDAQFDGGAAIPLFTNF